MTDAPPEPSPIGFAVRAKFGDGDLDRRSHYATIHWVGGKPCVVWYLE